MYVWCMVRQASAVPDLAAAAFAPSSRAPTTAPAAAPRSFHGRFWYSAVVFIEL